MRRELKFRVWDPENTDGATMHYTDPLKIFENVLCADYDFKQPYYNCNTDTFHIMQYTGLQDKNGKDIYEGDILCFERDHNTKNYIPWIIVFNAEKGYKTWHSANDDAIIIGNSYENPELLPLKNSKS